MKDDYFTASIRNLQICIIIFTDRFESLGVQPYITEVYYYSLLSRQFFFSVTFNRELSEENYIGAQLR